jgi:hypothetical protein
MIKWNSFSLFLFIPGVIGRHIPNIYAAMPTMKSIEQSLGFVSLKSVNEFCDIEGQSFVDIINFRQGLPCNFFAQKLIKKHDAESLISQKPALQKRMFYS